jgi:protein-S-isoprenylcysteine O-methyltransferase Ste14
VPDVIWHGPSAIWALTAAGLALVVYSTILTNHFELFGLRKPVLALLGRPYQPIPFVEAGLYSYVRHPMMTGFMIWMWATPTMSVGHAILAAGMTVYILVGMAFEERAIGAQYADYKRRVGAFMPKAACLRRRAR